MAQDPAHRPEFRHDERWEPHHHHHRHRRDWDRDEGWERRHGRDDWDRHEEWEGRHHRPHGGYAPGLLDLALAKPFLLGSLAMQVAPYYQRLCGLGLRVAEAALMKPLMLERAWLRNEGWGLRHPHWEHERCEEHEECEEHEGRDECEERCERCGCPREECRCEHREHRRGADIHIDSRQGDLRHRVILVENNSPRAVTVTPEAEAWMDASGSTVPTTVTFNPASQDLAPGEAKEFNLAILVAVPPLQSGVSYFTRIHLKGSPARPVSIELHVEPAGRIDFLADTDPCRPRRGRFVEFHEERCERPRRRHHREHCPPRHCEPFPWWGYDPCCTWGRPGGWERFWLAPRPGARCC